MLTADVQKLCISCGRRILVLLIGGLNIANLALARLALRRKELATASLWRRPSAACAPISSGELGIGATWRHRRHILGAGLLRTLNSIASSIFPALAKFIG